MIALALQGFGQASLNMSQVGNLPYLLNLSDVWGWQDSTGTEYALVGVFNGFSVVSLNTPSNPVEVAFFQGANSIWRDIKTRGRFAYVTHDIVSSPTPAVGLLIVDLDSVAFGQTPDHVYRFVKATDFPGDSMRTAHNLWIDENGVMYLFGADVGNGGALMYDIATDPWNPAYLGNYNDVYLHDGYARGDTLYGAAILAGDFRIIDVSNKAQPITLGSKITPNSFCHNVWLSDNGNTLFTTDEVSGAYVAAYDISDPNNITELDRKQTSLGTGVIPHNAHVYGNFVVTSYYTSGVQVLDATYPDIMVETGYYDTSPLFSGGGFHGAWGAYPYLPSGLVLVSDIEEGLFVISSEYKQATYLDVTVQDSLTGAPINLASLQLNGNFLALTNVLGRYKNGFTQTGSFWLKGIKNGYQSDSIQIQFQAGLRNNVVFKLLPVGFGLEQSTSRSLVVYPNPGSEGIYLADLDQQPIQVEAVTTSGQVFPLSVQTDGSRWYCNTQHLPVGAYILSATTPQAVYHARWFKGPSLSKP
jgi:choice-of-anchor B domain-containing protein